MRARYTIGHRVFVPGAKDDMGIPVPAWAPAVDLKVYSLAPVAVDPEPVTGRLAVVELLAVLVPAGASLGPHDRYVIEGTEWEQEGHPGDYTRGPFVGPVSAGLVLTLRKVEG